MIKGKFGKSCAFFQVKQIKICFKKRYDMSKAQDWLIRR